MIVGVDTGNSRCWVDTAFCFNSQYSTDCKGLSHLLSVLHIRVPLAKTCRGLPPPSTKAASALKHCPCLRRKCDPPDPKDARQPSAPAADLCTLAAHEERQALLSILFVAVQVPCHTVRIISGSSPKQLYRSQNNHHPRCSTISVQPSAIEEVDDSRPSKLRFVGFPRRVYTGVLYSHSPSV